MLYAEYQPIKPEQSLLEKIFSNPVDNVFLLVFTIELTIRFLLACWRRQPSDILNLGFGIDFFAVVPSLLLLVWPISNFPIRLIRTLRLFRILKIGYFKNEEKGEEKREENKGREKGRFFLTGLTRLT